MVVALGFGPLKLIPYGVSAPDWSPVIHKEPFLSSSGFLLAVAVIWWQVEMEFFIAITCAVRQQPCQMGFRHSEKFWTGATLFCHTSRTSVRAASGLARVPAASQLGCTQPTECIRRVAREGIDSQSASQMAAPPTNLFFTISLLLSVLPCLSFRCCPA